MNPAAFLLGLALLTVPVPAALAQTQSPTAAITVTRVGDGCDIQLSSEAAKTVQDQVWLVIDGKSEGFGGGGYFPDDAAKPLHFAASVSSDLDGQVKDILKAQGVSVNPKIVTYQVSFGVNRPDEASRSQTLHFRHGSDILAFTPHFGTATYKLQHTRLAIRSRSLMPLLWIPALPCSRHLGRTITFQPANLLPCHTTSCTASQSRSSSCRR